MCYDVKAQLETQLNRAIRDGDVHAIREIKEKLAPLTDLPIYHSSGFKHPKLLVYTNESPNVPVVSQWGLGPYWAFDKEKLYKAWNKTLNARGEDMFETKSFKSSAKSKRCIIQVDGFYEHMDYKGKKYPHFIYRKDGQPLSLGGLWREWKDKETGETLHTFAIVTTRANSLMEEIHNKPAASQEPRMPVILPEELEDKWLSDYDEELVENAIAELLEPFPAEEMVAHTVGRIRGKEYKGNIDSIDEKVVYPELNQQELF
ncbi:SOS response-associated peptidase [Flavobacteriaceae bacterium TP-CH-4]|uniref:Abasic site processing protein n=1 Tax=Pelagihabitans pacificus TaxID=2696054 RepID=A0A967ATM2_9FLAO|nr:SOS response-associated peptidase [Pelagihabitans pacificus]NHF60164.1 SOS response-associated peptidase [Pelagihabitans pacificus]